LWEGKGREMDQGGREEDWHKEEGGIISKKGREGAEQRGWEEGRGRDTS
jgi:hypothetical protein